MTLECKNSALCIFDKQPVQTDIVRSYVEPYYPISGLTGPIEFCIEGNTEDYIDCNDIFLFVQYTITKSDGTKIDAAKDKVATINLPLASLFKDVSLVVGSEQIEGGQQCYPYLAYFPTILQMHPAAQKSHMHSFGWKRDEAGKFDDQANKAHVERQKWTEGGRTYEVYGPLFLDFLRQSRYLISQVDMRIKLMPQKPEFALMSFDAAPAFKVKITKAMLYVRRLRMNPSVINGHMQGMLKRNAVYPINHSKLIDYTIPAGQRSYTRERLFPLQTPKILVVALVENDAYNGAYQKNPFNFQHFNLSEIILYRNGLGVPGRPFTPDFSAGTKHYIRSYINTMQTMSYFNTDDTNGLTFEEFGGGYTLYAFDLTADNNVSAPYRQVLSTANLRLDLKFSANLTNTVNLLLYAVFDSQVEITHSRDVLTEYTR